MLSLPSPHALRWIVPDGRALPLELGSAGRVLSGEIGPQGWVASVEEREAGVASVSAPVRSAHGDLVAAVSISGPVERLVATAGRALRRQVVDAAAGIILRLTRFVSPLPATLGDVGDTNTLGQCDEPAILARVAVERDRPTLIP